MKKNLKVEDLMDRVFLSFDPETSVQNAVETLHKKRLFGGCVADREGKVLGILSEKKCIDLYEKAAEQKSPSIIEKATVMDIMYDHFKTIPKTTGIAEAAQIFLETEFRRLPVVDNDVLVGQITRRDIIRVIDLFSK